MGIEQSSYQTASTGAQKVTGTIPKTKLRRGSTQASSESGRSSPHPSLCSSETDVPYVSYTVNKPIGDSPKHLGKANERYGKGSQALFAPSKPVKGRNIVVVSQKSMMDGGEEDADLLNLQRIPLFLPIIRSSLSTTHPREPDIVDRLDTGALQRMVSLLQDVMRHNAESTAGQQNQLALATREVDSQLSAIMAALTERQKQYARHTEKLARIHEVSHSLSRCQLALTTALDSIETLNGQLPPSERLEPFVWSTG